MGSTNFFKGFMEDVDYYRGKDVQSRDFTTCFYITSPTFIFYLGLSSFYTFVYGFAIQAAIKTASNAYTIVMLLKQLARTLVIY